MSRKISVNLATLESKKHEVNAIKSGIKIYEAGKAEFELKDSGEYIVVAEDKSGRRGGMIVFTRDGCDIEKFVCNCGVSDFGETLCKHIVACVLAIQGGIVETNIKLGKKGMAQTIVTNGNTAKAVASGSLDVFATPVMISLMEQAACDALADVLEKGQTSVGTNVNVYHNAATPIGMKITAMAVIESVSGRNIKFVVSAADEKEEIGIGTHTRAIIDAERFMKKTNAKIPME